MSAGTPSVVRLAIINNSVTPYRIHLHLRLAREMKDLQIWSVFTHDASNAPWCLDTPDEIRPLFFGSGEDSLLQDTLRSQPQEWRKAGKILRWLESKGIGAVVLGGYNDIGRLRILWHCHQLGIPCFLFADSNIHCEGVVPWRVAVKRLLLPCILHFASGILCCGRFGEEYFRNYGITPERLFRFPYEPDYRRIEAVPAGAVDSARATFGLRPERRYLIYSGRLVAAKRVDLLLEAFVRIATARPDLDLIIAGDGALRASLERMIPEQLVRRVIWTGFINEPDRLHALYAASHVLVLPSDYEPWGVVVTEAAVRMPVVASSVVGAAADLITDGVNGKIFESGNAACLEKCLLEATAPAALLRTTLAAPVAFRKWHAQSDPVQGLRAALLSVSPIDRR